MKLADMYNHRDIIKNLEQLELSNIPVESIKDSLSELGKFGAVITTLHQGKIIIRARLTEAVPFQKISELSYKPQEFNEHYQRASTPFNTVFYGSIVPEIQNDTEPDTARITAAFEISEFVRSIDSVGQQRITFSAWEVIEDIELVSLIHHKDFIRPTKLSVKLQQEFEQFIESDKDLKIPSFEITNFLARQFAKEPINLHTDYMISASYSELVSSICDGVLYPSVRLKGEGINVAIKKDSADTKLKFIGASEGIIYKNGIKVHIGNNTQSEISDANLMRFLKVEDQYYTSVEEGRRIVGLD